MKKITLALISILTPIVLYGATVPVNVLRDTSGFIRPIQTTDNLRIPALGGGGVLCLQVDDDGDVSVALSACGSGGGGSGGGTFSTTTSQVSGQLINYPNNATDIVAIGSNSTTTSEFWFNPNNGITYLSGKVGVGTTSPYAKLSVVGEVVGSHFTGTTTATSTLGGDLTLGLGKIFTGHAFRSDASDGVLLQANNYTNVGIFGAGNTSNSTFYGAVNIDGATRLATSLTGVLQAISGAVTATSTISQVFIDSAIARDSELHSAVTVTDSATVNLTLTGQDITADGLYTAGDHLTLTGADFDVDDDFLLNTGDTGTGSYTLSYASTTGFSTTYASSTEWRGGGLVSDCTGASNKLTWNSTTGRFACESDVAGSGGTGLATSTAIADTLVIYGTSASTVGAEAAFAYDDATNILTAGELALTTDLSVANGGSGASTLTGLLLGNGTSPFTGITTSSGIFGAISDETGSGSLVGSVAPTLTGVTTLANSSTTLASFAYASSTLWHGGGLQTCDATTGKLTWANGQFTCGTDFNTGGGGGGGGTFSTTTSTVAGQLINYATNATDILAIGANATTSAEFWYDPNAQIGYLSGNFGIGTTSPYSKLSVVGQVVASNYLATTTATSTFNGSLAVTETNATSTFAGGIDMSDGCYAIDGVCIGGAGGAGDSIWEAFDGTTGIRLIDPTADVNIGDTATTSYANFSPDAKLGVLGDLLVYGDVDGGVTAVIANSSSTASAYTELLFQNASATPEGVYYGSLSYNSGVFNDPTYGSATNLANGLSLINTAGSIVVNASSTCAQGGNIIFATGGSANSSIASTISCTGALGIGTTSPSSRLVVTNPLSTNTVLFEDVANDDTPFVIKNDGKVGIGTTTPYSSLSVLGLTVSSNFYATSTTATSTFDGGLNVGNGTLEFIRSTGVTSVDALETGLLSFDNDVGLVTGLDMPIVSLANDTQVGYVLNIDATTTPPFAVTGQSNGSGGVKNVRIGIGTSTPMTAFTVADYNTATTTVTFGKHNGTGAVCHNTVNTSGASISFYFVGTTMVVENNLCK